MLPVTAAFILAVQYLTYRKRPIWRETMISRQHEHLSRDNESLARALAAAARVDWHSLPDYPGYGKNYWREKARALFKQDAEPVRSA